MAVRNAGPAGSKSRYAALALGAILLGGCATAGKHADTGETLKYKQAVGVFTNPEADTSQLDPIAAAAFWGTRYEREPQSAEMAVRYSQALRKIGSATEASAVMAKASARHPDDPDVNLEYGKTLVEDGRSFEAVRYLEAALSDRAEDWRALSAYGVALDQIGEHETARLKYDAALRIAPDAVSVISNKGLSYALSGDLSKSIATLRMAAAHRRADARIRQNLALALAINGDMREAERLARSDLPPQLADKNVQYFRSLMSQPAHWRAFAADDYDAPPFNPVPAAEEPPPALPRAAPRLKEEPKPAPKADPKAPIALAPATPATSAATVLEEEDEVPAPDLKSY